MSINTLKHNICQIEGTLSRQAETNILWPYVLTARRSRKDYTHQFICQQRKPLRIIYCGGFSYWR